MTAGQITAVTHGADAVSGRTGHRRASTHLVDPHGLNALYPGFIDHGTRGHENLIALWSHHITRHNTAHDAIPQRFNDVTTFNDRRQRPPFVGTTVYGATPPALRPVNQPA